MTRGLIFLLMASVTLLAKEPEPAQLAAPYNSVFDPWRARSLAEPLAMRAAPDALRTMFLSAYVRWSWPFNGPEGDEAMHHSFERVFAKLGDARFAATLGQQRPEVRSAVRQFLTVPKGPQRTHKLLREAPEIDWPMVRAARDFGCCPMRPQHTTERTAVGATRISPTAPFTFSS